MQSTLRELGGGRSVTKVEGLEPRFELAITRGDGVKRIFHGGRELVVDEVGEVRGEKIDHGKGLEGRDQSFALLPDVTPSVDCLHHRRVRRRATNTEVFKLLDQRGFAEAIRWLGVVALGVSQRNGGRGAFGQRRQEALLVGQLTLGVVTTFDVGPTETGELNAQTVGAQTHFRGSGSSRQIAQRGEQSDAIARQFGIDHLRSNSALPDEVVDGVLISGELRRRFFQRAEALTGRTDSFVRLLGVLHLAVIGAGNIGHVVVTEHLAGVGAGGVERFLRQRGRVGSHVGNPALLVEPLGGPHRALGVHT